MSVSLQCFKLFLLVLFVFASKSTSAAKKGLNGKLKGHVKSAEGARKMKNYTWRKGKGTPSPTMSPTTSTSPSIKPTITPIPSLAPSTSNIPSPEIIPETGGASGGNESGNKNEGGSAGGNLGGNLGGSGGGNPGGDENGDLNWGGTGGFPPTGGTNENVATPFTTPQFLLKFTLGESQRFRGRTRYLEEALSTDLNTYRKDFLGENVLNFLGQGGPMKIVSLDCTKVTQGNEFIIAEFGEGNGSVMATAPPSSEQTENYILATFNHEENKEIFLDMITNSEDEALKKVIDVEVLFSESESLSNEGEVHTYTARSTGNFITGMIVGIFAVTATVSAIYHRRKQKMSRAGCELTEYYNNNDSFDEDANPRSHSVEEMLSPHGSWRSNASANSLEDIALSSVNNDADASSIVAPVPWNLKKMSMSRLAAGATQDEFAQNGMCVDAYGQRQCGKKKRKKSSPVMNAKKGSELDTNLDPIVEVSSSVASSLVSQTDDKMVKGTSEIPQLLPALSVSSCPSDEGNFPACSYSPVDAPALTALSPDTFMSDDSMTPAPYDTPLTSKSLQQYTRISPSSDEGSPIRRLSFETNEIISERESDKSSDSGVRDLLACQKDTENVVVLSEAEALKASLITFIDDENQYKRTTHEEEDGEDIIRRTLGFVSDDDDEKENSSPSISKKIENSNSEEDYNATILVLGQTQN